MATTYAQSEANKAKARALGVPESIINSHGGELSNNELQQSIDRWNSIKPSAPVNTEWLNALPDFLKNDPTFKALSLDQQEIIAYNYRIQLADNEEDAKKLGTALEQATAMAEPYWQTIAMIAQDEVLRNFEVLNGDYNSSVQRQQRIVEKINTDLMRNKDFLSLEQQSDLATLARNYEVNHENLVDSAAGAGLTFSTKRKIAEKRLAEENQGLVESTTRSYNKQIADLQAEADSGNIEAQKEIEDLTRKLGESKTSLGRAAETYLGTSNLPTLEGYTPLGNEKPIAGKMYEEKTADIEARKNALYNEMTSASLDLTI